MNISDTRQGSGENGFTIVELILAITIFPFLVFGVVNAFQGLSKSYRVSRQLNEMYAVLSACPELDRALDFSILSGGTNCFPNNTFKAEGGSGNTITYTPTLNVTNTSALPVTDPLRTVPDSKAVEVNTGYSIDSSGTPLKLRLLITRNGVAQQ
jgi:hypothetical protein